MFKLTKFKIGDYVYVKNRYPKCIYPCWCFNEEKYCVYWKCTGKVRDNDIYFGNTNKYSFKKRISFSIGTNCCSGFKDKDLRLATEKEIKEFKKIQKKEKEIIKQVQIEGNI